MAVESVNIVFVYGTLKRGFYNHHYLHGSVYLGEFITDAKYTMYDYGEYPAVIVRGHTAISGELFQVEHGVMKDLDELEEYPLFYDRIQIHTPHGLAWMYVVNQVQPGAIVVDGNWLPEASPDSDSSWNTPV